MSTSEHAAIRKDVMNALEIVSADTKFYNKCLSVVTRIFTGHIPKTSTELAEITRDAIQESITSTMESKLGKRDESEDGQLDNLGSLTKPDQAERYVFQAVINYAQTRANRWGSKEDGTAAARARLINHEEDDNEWLETLIDKQGAEHSDSDKPDLINVLNNLNLDNDKANLLIMKSNGMTNAEIADVIGSTEEAVRKIISRSIAKANKKDR